MSREVPLIPIEPVPLLPCPFCGGEAQTSRRRGYAFALCGKCHAEGPVARADATHAASAWNRRWVPAPASEGAVRGLVEALRFFDVEARDAVFNAMCQEAADEIEQLLAAPAKPIAPVPSSRQVAP